MERYRCSRESHTFRGRQAHYYPARLLISNWIARSTSSGDNSAELSLTTLSAAPLLALRTASGSPIHSVQAYRSVDDATLTRSVSYDDNNTVDILGYFALSG
ncbi:MAG: hypothetical protein H0X25_17795 [Acidobacteriales bacterium]|nr:hypothetical protein [Terriglobales bacterium]